MFYYILAVGLGGAIGAIIRWLFSLWLADTALPMSTLIVNLLGAYLIGLLAAFFLNNTTLPLELKLLVITGILGGLTTFSTFSWEMVQLIQTGKLSWSLALIMAHVMGSLLMTMLGIWTYKQLS